MQRGLQARPLRQATQPVLRPVLHAHRQCPANARVLPGNHWLRRGAARAVAEAGPTADDVLVKVSVKHHTGFGQRVMLVGGCEALGNWKPAKGVALAWSEGDMWHGEFAVPPGTPLEFKVVVYSPETKEAQWEEAGNKRLQVPEEPGELVAELGWGVAEVPTPAFTPSDMPVEVGGPAPAMAAYPAFNGAAAAASGGRARSRSRSPSPAARAPSPGIFPAAIAAMGAVQRLEAMEEASSAMDVLKGAEAEKGFEVGAATRVFDKAARSSPARANSPASAGNPARAGSPASTGNPARVGSPASSSPSAEQQRAAGAAVSAGGGSGRGKPGGVRSASAVAVERGPSVDPVTSFASVDEGPSYAAEAAAAARGGKRNKGARARSGSPGMGAKGASAFKAAADDQAMDPLDQANAEWAAATAQLKNQMAALRARSRSRSRSPTTVTGVTAAGSDTDEPMGRVDASLGQMLSAVGPHEKDRFEANGARRSPSPPKRLNTAQPAARQGAAAAAGVNASASVSGDGVVAEDANSGQQMVAAVSLTVLAGLTAGYAYLLQQGVDIEAMLANGPTANASTLISRSLPSTAQPVTAVAEAVGGASSAFSEATSQATDALMGAMKGTSDFLQQMAEDNVDLLDDLAAQARTTMDAAGTAAMSSLDAASTAMSSSVEAASSALGAASSAASDFMEDAVEAGAARMDVIAAQTFSLQDALNALKLDALTSSAQDAMESAGDALSDAVSGIKLDALSDQLSDQFESVSDAVSDAVASVSLPEVDLEGLSDSAKDSFESMGDAVNTAVGSMKLDLTSQASEAASQAASQAARSFEAVTDAMEDVDVQDMASKTLSAIDMDAAREAVSDAVAAAADAMAEPAAAMHAGVSAAAENATDAAESAVDSARSVAAASTGGAALDAVSNVVADTMTSAVTSAPVAAVNAMDAMEALDVAPAGEVPSTLQVPSRICLPADHPIVSSILSSSDLPAGTQQPSAWCLTPHPGEE